MFIERALSFWLGMLLLASSAAHAQSPEIIVQQAVDTERMANQNDHSCWIYFEESRKAKEHLLQWVAVTQHGELRRVLQRGDRKLADPEQRELMERFLRDSRAQKKEVDESKHDNQQVDDLLKLLPEAFHWTETSSTPAETHLHFEPNPEFHPPTREARVFSGMTGDVEVDNRQHRIRSMRGHLTRDVTFGAGLLGRLKEGSSFALEQAQVDGSLWQLTAIHVHLEGNALLFRSISLQEDDERSRFEPQSSTLTFDQAMTVIMSQPEEVSQGRIAAEPGPLSRAGDR